MGRLEGKVAVILGAAGEGNMGQTIARRFSREGARCVVAGRRPHRCRRSQPKSAVGMQSATSRVRPTSKRWRKLPSTPVVESTLRSIARVGADGEAPRYHRGADRPPDRAAVQGPLFFLQVFAGLMAQSGGGSIITMSSASVYALLTTTPPISAPRPAPMRWYAASRTSSCARREGQFDRAGTDRHTDDRA